MHGRDGRGVRRLLAAVVVVLGAASLVATSPPPDEIVADSLRWDVDVAPGGTDRAMVHLAGTVDDGRSTVFGNVAVRWRGPGDPPAGAQLRWTTEQESDVVVGEQVGWEQNVRWVACQGCATGVRLELSLPPDASEGAVGSFELLPDMQVEDPGRTDATLDASLETGR